MKIVVLDGYAANPGDLNWDELRTLGAVSYTHLISGFNPLSIQSRGIHGQRTLVAHTGSNQ